MNRPANTTIHADHATHPPDGAPTAMPGTSDVSVSAGSTSPRCSRAAGVALAQSFDHCRAVARRRARNFYYGMRLTPEPKRSAMYAIYAWMRLADDLADEADECADKVARLDAFRAQTVAAVTGDALPDGPIWPAVRAVTERHAIPADYLHAMIDGQVQDMRQTRYATFDDLYQYCYRVASVVGLTCLAVWGYTGGADTRQLAEQRGIAFQLTNILRDVREDAQRGRVYVPQDMAGRLELSPDRVAAADPHDLHPVLKTLSDHAGRYYERSRPLDYRIHKDGRACLAAMTGIYRGIHCKIAADPTVVLRKRVRLSAGRKVWIGLRASMLTGSR